jgi:hypothetical protein
MNDQAEKDQKAEEDGEDTLENGEEHDPEKATLFGHQ